LENKINKSIDNQKHHPSLQSDEQNEKQLQFLENIVQDNKKIS
jgi:hypothetical protein